MKVNDADSFEWLSGGEELGRYQSSSHSARWFCTSCGAYIAAEIDGGKMLAVTAATLDTSLEVTGVHHMFASSCADWFNIPVDETSYDQYPPYLSQFTPTD